MPFGYGRSGGGSGGGGGRGRGDKKPGDKEKGQRRPMFRRRKVCKFCADKIDDINYKDVKLLGPFVPERGKILPRRISGTCAMHQRKLQLAEPLKKLGEFDIPVKLHREVTATIKVKVVAESSGG